MLHCNFSGDYNSERIFKIGLYLTKLCVEHLGFTCLAHPVGLIEIMHPATQHGVGVIITLYFVIFAAF